MNARTLEICRAAGVDMQAVAAAAKAPSEAGFVYWVTKLGVWLAAPDGSLGEVFPEILGAT